jgi:3-isopropylmalate/(R)-2-methylmalate dehydratase small subunit
MNAYTSLNSRVVLLPVNDIDTDQIIPARYLKTTDKVGLGANLFSDWRYRADGSADPNFVLNQPESQGAQILMAGQNFGCGSSREHAPWALMGFGFRAVIAMSFADIFRNNSLKNGLLPVAIEPEPYARLLKILRAKPDTHLTVDLGNQVLVLPDEEAFSFPLDGFSKTCLLTGVDELGYLMQMEDKIAAYERLTALG